MKRISIILAFIICNALFGQQVNVNQESKLSVDIFETITFNGIWSWFSDPRAVYYKANKERTYIGWVDNYGDIYIAFYDHISKEISSRMIYDNLEIDDHNNPSIIIDNNGYILLFFSSHLQEGKPIYFLKSKLPENIDEWEELQTLFLKKNSEEINVNYTYTNPIQLKEENNKLFLFSRGISKKPAFIFSEDNAENWSDEVMVFEPNSSNSIPYTKVYSDGVSKIHFVITNNHPTKSTENALYYFYYEKGAFYRVDGTKICSAKKMPIREADLQPVFKSKKSVNKVWNWDVAQAIDGKPIIVFTRFPDEKKHIYCYALWNGNKWEINDIVDSGGWFPKTIKDSPEPEPHYSGGISLDHENPKTIYISIKRNNVFEIEKWTTLNNGKKWKKQSITSNSRKDNVRPFAVRGAKSNNPFQVLWLENNNYIYYGLSKYGNGVELDFKDRYHSSIKMNLKSSKKTKDLTKSQIFKLSQDLIDEYLGETGFNDLEYNFKNGMLYHAIKKFSNLTKDEKYPNEILNIKQQTLSNEENDYKSDLSFCDLIWNYGLEDERAYQNLIENITDENLKSIPSNVLIPTLIKLLEEDNLDKSLITNFLKVSLENIISNYKQSDEIFEKALYAYSLAYSKNNNLLNSEIDLSKAWSSIFDYLIDSKRSETGLEVSEIAIVVLAALEIFKSLK